MKMPVDIKGKQYVMVNERVQEFHEKYPNGKIVTTIVDTNFEDSICMKSRVVPDMKHPDRYFTGYAWEKIGSSQINRTSFLENCETSAVGRAIGFLGLGSVDSIASAEEVSNAIHQQEYTITDLQKEMYQQYLKHPIFVGRKSDTNKWWATFQTEAQAKRGLESMLDRMDKYDAKKAKKVKELINENS